MSSLGGLRRAGFVTQSVALVAAMALSCLLFGGLAGWIFGRVGLEAAGVAAGLCWLGSEAGLIVDHLFRRTSYGHFGFMAGAVPRMGAPLIFGLIVQIANPPIAKAGFLLYLVVFYLVGLAFEAMVTMPAGKKT